MKKQILTMFTGLFIGAIITGGASAYAAGILAERSNHRIFVDGQEVQMEAYAVNGNNYVKLRDIGKAVGFEVYWDGDAKCVQVESGQALHRHRVGESGDQRTCFTAGGYDACR